MKKRFFTILVSSGIVRQRSLWIPLDLSASAVNGMSFYCLQLSKESD